MNFVFRMKEPKVADFLKTFRKNMLEKASDSPCEIVKLLFEIDYNILLSHRVNSIVERVIVLILSVSDSLYRKVTKPFLQDKILEFEIAIR